MVVSVSAATGFVVMVNVADVCPAATETVLGRPIAPDADVTETCTPLAGAGASSVMVPAAGVPPVTLAGAILTDATPTADENSLAASELPAISTERYSTV
jgi:hypothetical protein